VVATGGTQTGRRDDGGGLMSLLARRTGWLSDWLTAWRRGISSSDAKAICPVDSWAFRPRYTDGRCPLCGWEPPGVVVRLPLSRRVDAFGWLTVSFVLASVAMVVLVALVYALS
jgi:hypothetical protein